MKKDLILRNKKLNSIEFRLNRLDQNRKALGLPSNTDHLLVDLENEITKLESNYIKQLERIKANAHLI